MLVNRGGRGKVTNKLVFAIRSAVSPRAYGYVSTLGTDRCTPGTHETLPT